MSLSELRLPAAFFSAALLFTPAPAGAQSNTPPELVFSGGTEVGEWRQLGGDIAGEAAGDGTGGFLGISGVSVALSADGTTAIYGASENDGNGDGAGHARIFEYDAASDEWEQLGADINGEAEGERAGTSVSLSADGRTAIVGANRAADGAGTTRVYGFDEGLMGWVQLGADIDGGTPADASGNSVALSEDGRTAIVGAFRNREIRPNAGAARIYRFDEASEEWVQLGSDILGEELLGFLGDSVALTPDGRTAIIGAPRNDGSGTAEVYRFNDDLGDWIQLGSDIQGEGFSSRFGDAVAIAAGGNTVFIGASTSSESDFEAGQSRAYRYDEALEDWIQLGSAIDGEASGDDTGFSVSLSADGFTAIIGSPGNDRNGSDSGNARIYRYDEDLEEWIQFDIDLQGKDESDRAGEAVAMSADGRTVIVGASENDGTGGEAGYVSIYGFVEGYRSSSPENSTFVIDADATDNSDAEGSGLSYSITGGDDGALFAINASTGVLTFISAPNFEAPLDVDGDNIYGLQITVIDSGALTDVRDLEIVVTDVVENFPPSLVFTGGISEGDWQQLGGDIDGEAAGDNSGESVALSGDGRLLIIGASNNSGINGQRSGHARIYRYINGLDEWVQFGDDIDGEDSSQHSGESVAMSGDGSTVIVGAPDAHANDPFVAAAGHARVYRLNEVIGNWEQLGSDIDGLFQASDFGEAVALSEDGNTAIISDPSSNEGSSNSGQVRVFTYDDASEDWIQLGGDILGEGFSVELGHSVALDKDGRTAIIGAPNYAPTQERDDRSLGLAEIYRYDEALGDWLQLGGDIVGESRFLSLGASVDLAENGNVAVIGVPGAGEVRAYEYNEVLEEWEQFDASIKDVSIQSSESSVALAAEGNTVIIGIRGTGINGTSSGFALVYQYDELSETWTRLGNELEGEAAFDDAGVSVAISAEGRTVAVGAPRNDGNGADSGSTRVYALIEGNLKYSFPENAVFMTNVNASDDSDAEGSGLSYSLGGEDSSFFTLDASTGELAFAAAPDFEAPGDIGGDNIYKVQITVTDSDALTDVRDLEVTVTDVPENTPPVIALNGPASVVVECVIGSYIEAATASDAQDADSSLQLVVTGGPVSTAVPGTFMLTYNVTDSGGLTAAPVTRTVTVVDTTAPVISLIGGASIAVEAGTGFTDPGTTITEACDAGASVSAGGDTVNPDVPGTYTLTYNSTDSSNNPADQITRTVTVADTTPPVITLTGEGEISLIANVDSYAEAGATAADSFDTDVSVTIGGETVDTTTPGTYIVTYDASDDATNPAPQVTRTVTVTATPTYSIIATDAVKAEGDSGTTDFTFTVTRAGTTTGTGSVSYNTSPAGDDFSGSTTGTVSFSSGETTQTVTIAVAGDEIVELDETFAVALSAPQPSGTLISTGTANGTITNDEAFVITIADATTNEDDEALTFTATLDRAVDAAVTVDYSTADGTALAGSDYTASNGTLTFEGTAGETETFTVPLTADTDREPDEQFFVDLENATASGRSGSIGDGRATGTIRNDDSLNFTIEAIDADAAEGDSPNTGTFRITSNNAASPEATPVTISRAGSSAEPTEYTLSGGEINFAGETGIATIAAGESFVDIIVTPLTDDPAEAAETVLFALEGGSPAEVTITQNGFLVTTTNDAGEGSLRQAITNANAIGGDDTVAFADGVEGSIRLATALPGLSDGVVIKGPGADLLEVDAGGTSSVFVISRAVEVQLSGLTITGGRASSGGGISAAVAGTSVTVERCVISGNAAVANGSQVAPSGGGIFAVNGELVITDSTVSENISEGSGGGIFIDGDSLFVTNGTISGNTAAADGGGISGSALLILSSTTITRNEAKNSGGLDLRGSFPILENTIVAGNFAQSNPDIRGSLSSTGINLVGDGTGATGLKATDLVGTSSDPIDPILGVLQVNGGTTPTHALLPGSPAIEAGAADLLTDQRGVTRPQGVQVDIGAYELVEIPPSVEDFAITLPEDFVYTFTIDEFAGAFSDPNPGDALAAIRIESLPGGTLALRGSAVSVGSEVLRADIELFTYTPVADFNGTDSFTYSASDGGDFAPVVAGITVLVTEKNDAPVIDFNGFTPTYVVRDIPTSVTDVDGFTITDVDSSELTFAIVLLQPVPDGEAEVLAASPSGDIAASEISYAAGVLRISAAASPADYQAVLRSLTYVNSATTPDRTSRTLTFIASDGELETSGAVTMLPITSSLVAQDDQLTRRNGLGLTVSTAELLENDTDLGGNIPLIVSSVTYTGVNGADVGLENGSVSYNPNGHIGSDSFEYTVTNSVGDTATASVAISFAPDFSGGDFITVLPGGVVGIQLPRELGDDGTANVQSSETLDESSWADLEPGQVSVGSDGETYIFDPRPPVRARFYRIIIR